MDAKELGAMPIGSVQGQAWLHPDTGLPKDPYGYGWAVDPQPGLTLRQHFAGLALQGIMANPERWKQIASDYAVGKKSYEQCSAANAAKAVSVADALLAELAKDPT